MTVQFGNNMISTAGDDSKKKDKRGDGINEVLVLLKELRDFQDRVATCAEAQALAENRSKIEEFGASIEKMYMTLLDMAKSGIKSIRTQQGVEQQESTPAVEVLENMVKGKDMPDVETKEVTAPVPPKM